MFKPKAPTIKHLAGSESSSYNLVASVLVLEPISNVKSNYFIKSWSESCLNASFPDCHAGFYISVATN